jgi:hypothetical protein
MKSGTACVYNRAKEIRIKATKVLDGAEEFAEGTPLTETIPYGRRVIRS